MSWYRSAICPTSRVLFLAVIVLTSLTSGTGCMTGNYIIEEGPQHRWISPVASVGNDTPVLEAYTDSGNTKLCVKYRAETKDSDYSTVNVDVWANVDLAKLFDRARRCKPERQVTTPTGLEAGRLPEAWLEENAKGNPAFSDEYLWRQGRVLYVDEQSFVHEITRRASTEPQWPLDKMRPVQLYAISSLVLGDQEKVRVDAPGVLGVVKAKDPLECWFTTPFPDDLGGGNGVVGFTIRPDRRMRPGAKAALPLTILFDSVTSPIQLPFAVLGVGQAVRNKAQEKKAQEEQAHPTQDQSATGAR